MFAVLGLSINCKDRDAAGSDAFLPDTPWDDAGSDAVSPQAKRPVLKIEGKENRDVYLQSLDIQVEVTGNIASTRYTMVFKNRTNRILEGELTFPLSEGRSVTHYALDINGKMREAVPVEKAGGTQVFEEIEQRRVDPGLLERVEGNNFRTRIYPIPANGSRTVSIGYEEELTLEKKLLYYRLPVAYSDSLEKFAVRATVLKSSQKPLVPKSENEIRFEREGENYVASFVRDNTSRIDASAVYPQRPNDASPARRKSRPSSALVFALPAPAGIPQVMMQPASGSHYFLVSVAPEMELRKNPWDSNLAIIWDVSLSGSQRNLQREMEMLSIIFAEKKSANVHLYFLNNKLKANGEYKVVNGKWDKLRNVLETAVFDGGTDFSQINLNDIAGNEILFFSDGISTLSDANFLTDTAANRPVHCVVSSAKADYSVMKSIADKTNGKFMNVNALSYEKIRTELLYKTPLFLGTEHGNSVREVYPDIATPVQGNFSVAGISDTNDAELTLLFGFGNTVEKRIKVRLDAKNAVKHVNTYKIWAQKKISELDLDYEKNRFELMELGRQFGIVTRNTSLIVLETLGDYVRYGIEPPAAEPELLAEYQRRTGGIATPGTRVFGSGSFAAADNAVRSDADNRAFGGLGVLGIISGQIKGKSVASSDIFGKGGFATDIDAILSGVGQKGAGYSSGFGGGTGGASDLLGGLGNGSSSTLKKRGELNIASPDFVSSGNAANARSRASIQRVVMQNIASLRYAYNRRVRERPGLSGTITVKFAIDEFGTVIYAQVVESTINDPELEITVETRVRSWVFEKVNRPGDVTEITYPFAFSSDGYLPPGVPSVSQTREFVSQSREGVTLNGAATAAANLKKWWNINFPPIIPLTPATATYKYPVPDEKGGISNMGSAKGDFAKDNDYMNRLTGKSADDYQTYLNLRNDHGNSPAFYVDMANWFYTHGDRETALRVLTSIADLELEIASLYRLLGYRFKEYGEYALEKFVCQKVVEWRPMEPQSYRDYALALADNGEAQAALDVLYSLLRRYYSDNIYSRSRGMEEVVVMEINNLISKNPNLDTSKIDKRLIADIPVDIRVVINWNMDNTDIDLHVKDPNNEECYYNNRQTRIGGRISANITSGYGPEQFLLKNAAKGKYRVYVHYYGNNQFTSTWPPTVMAEIYTRYADSTGQRKVVCLQMSDANGKNGKAEMADFDF